MYGVILLLVIYIMPDGRRGSGATDYRPEWCDTAAERPTEGAMRNAKRALIAVGCGEFRPCGSGRRAEKKYDPGATDTEIKIGQTKP